MSVLMEAKRVKNFFLRYLFDDKQENELRHRLLAYIPEKCNYGCNPDTLVTELVSCISRVIISSSVKLYLWVRDASVK